MTRRGPDLAIGKDRETRSRDPEAATGPGPDQVNGIVPYSEEVAFLGLFLAGHRSADGLLSSQEAGTWGPDPEDFPLLL